MTESTDLPAAVTVGGEEWRLHSVAFRHDGSTWTTYLYARSWKEAERMLDSLKATGEVDGEMCGWIDGDMALALVDALVRDLNSPGGAS